MLAKTVKKQCIFARSRAINKLFHIRRYIRRFIGRYFNIGHFLLQTIWRTIFHIILAAGKKGDIGRYLGRLGRYLK